jgi:threonine dehydratase
MVSIDDIRAAAERIRGAVYRSPCPYSLALSRLCGCDVFCKLDYLQLTGSFKERGARNKLVRLTDDEKRRGIIAASAGNHAQAIAYHGQQLGIPVTVVMPIWAPLIKVGNCRSFGANVVQHGESFGAARDHAKKLQAEQNLTYVHGFDDPDIIAGAGTMGLEILEDVPDAAAVIIPIGGGGLMAGSGVAIKALKPDTHVIGVEPVRAPTYADALRAGKPVPIKAAPTIADGLAVAEIGTLCFDVLKQVVDEIVMVDEPEIARAIIRLIELEKAVVEGAAASSLAAATAVGRRFAGRKIVLALCGGNIDATLISRVIERGLAADGRLCRIFAGISDRPGSLAKVLAVIAEAGASVKEVVHDRHFGPADVGRVNVTFVLETRDHRHVEEVHEALRRAGVEISKMLPAGPG